MLVDHADPGGDRVARPLGRERHPAAHPELRAAAERPGHLGRAVVPDDRPGRPDVQRTRC